MVSQGTFQPCSGRCTRCDAQRMDGSDHTNLEVEAAGLVGLGEVLSCAGLEQCVELEVVLAYASLRYLDNVSRRREITWRSSSSLGFAWSFLESVMAFWNGADWATMFALESWGWDIFDDGESL